MDKKRSDSNPSTKTAEKRTETPPPDDDTLDTPRRERTHGGWTFMAQAHYDPDEPLDLTTVIIGAIAEADDIPITEIKNPPLYEVVDIAGIEDALFGRPKANRNGTDSTVEFRYNGYKISVEADGWVTVSSRSANSAADGK
ncbi:HalOD1 output domain-containing protein [Natrinema gelatinilyticum]|uniref:HalOD1 output domain-containing protein n=1 Tax=Natrinema gelatinilyticum TaxID=2961571 RepID=UPI0020C1EF86|nr:HalOD1 output domain-containing protein [Natrinema gelatinilyticum]